MQRVRERQGVSRALTVVRAMKSSRFLFAYGLEMNSALLHCVVAGPKPSGSGVFRLHGYKLTWSASGHLPNLERRDDAVTRGTLIHLNATQLQRLASSRLVPLLYRWQPVQPIDNRGRSRSAITLVSPGATGPGHASLGPWRETVLGGLEQGLPDAAIEELLSARPNDRRVILQAWDGPFAVRQPDPWQALDQLQEIADAA